MYSFQDADFNGETCFDFCTSENWTSEYEQFIEDTAAFASSKSNRHPFARVVITQNVRDSEWQLASSWSSGTAACSPSPIYRILEMPGSLVLTRNRKNTVYFSLVFIQDLKFCHSKPWFTAQNRTSTRNICKNTSLLGIQDVISMHALRKLFASKVWKTILFSNSRSESGWRFGVVDMSRNWIFISSHLIRHQKWVRSCDSSSIPFPAYLCSCWRIQISFVHWHKYTMGIKQN